MYKYALEECSESLRKELQACRTVSDVNYYMEKFVTYVCALSLSNITCEGGFRVACFTSYAVLKVKKVKDADLYSGVSPHLSCY